MYKIRLEMFIKGREESMENWKKVNWKLRRNEIENFMWI
jgi:hypothetical protein